MCARGLRKEGEGGIRRRAGIGVLATYRQPGTQKKGKNLGTEKQGEGKLGG